LADSEATELKEFLYSIVGAAPFGILTISLDGTVGMANTQTCELMSLDIEPNELIDTHYSELFKKFPEIIENIDKGLRKGRKAFELLEVLVEKKFLNLKFRVILKGYLLIIEDATEQRQARDKLSHAKNLLEDEVTERTVELQRSNMELEQYAYVASHDLQEPLRTIKNYVGLLNKRLSSSLEKNEQNFMEHILSAADRMSSLITDLLNFSRLGKVTAEIETINPNEIMKDLMKDMSSTLKAKKVNLTIDNLPNVKGYQVLFKQLFQNLISNAIKYQSGEHEPKISVSSEVTKNVCTFRIKDNGIGIDKTYFDKVFVVFNKLHTVNEYEGTGIGLATCKKIVELHNGKIWLNSKPNVGSTFYFTIPMETDA